MKFVGSSGLLFCVALAAGMSKTSLQAQSPVASTPTATSSDTSSITTSKPNEPSLATRSDKALEGFEPSLNEEYKLGAGDQVTLDFPGHTELTGTHTIGPDGVITIAIAGAVQIANLTREEASKAIENALSKYYTSPVVTVKIDKYSSNRVRVIGYVQHPGEITFEGTPTLLDAIGRAGLISPTVIANGVPSNIGPSVPETCTVYRGDSTAVEVNLRELLVSGNALADMRLRRNDIVFVPEPKHLFVSVLGQVAKPGSVPLTPESTLTSVLADAGCCTDPSGFNPKIHILQRSTGNSIVVEYKKLMTLAGQKEYTIHSGDVIWVPTSGFNKFTTILQKITPVATMATLATVVGAG